MEARIAFTAIAVCVLLGGAFVYFVHPPTKGPDLVSLDTPSGTEEAGTLIQPAPAVATSGPFPRAVVNEPAFNDRAAAIGREYTHNFIVRNEGFAGLKLARGKTPIRCVSKAFSGAEIPPGETAEVTVTWTAPTKEGPYSHTIDVRTNDPENPFIQLDISGRASLYVELSPMDPQRQYDWSLGDVGSSSTGKFTGHILSKTLDKFEILGITTSDSRVSVKTTLASAGERDGLGVAIKYAYRLDVEISDLPAGIFSYELRIRTDSPESILNPSHEAKILLWGLRSAPLTLFGPAWVSHQATVSMGRIERLEGKSVSMRLLVTDLPDTELKFLNVECPEFIEVKLSKTVSKDSSKPDQPRYDVSVSIPPGKLPNNDERKQKHLVKVVTSHPDAPAFEFYVLLFQ